MTRFIVRPILLALATLTLAAIHLKGFSKKEASGFSTQSYAGFHSGRSAAPQRQAAAFSSAIFEKMETLRQHQGVAAGKIESASKSEPAPANEMKAESKQAAVERQLQERFPNLSNSEDLFRFIAGTMTQTAIDAKVTENLLQDISTTAKNMSTLLESKNISTDERLAVIRLTDSMAHHELGLPLAENLLTEEVTRGEDLNETSEIRMFRLRVAIDSYFRYVPDLDRRNQFLELARSAQNRDQKVVDMIDSMSSATAAASAATAAAAVNANVDQPSNSNGNT